jgi:hypothetical protein
MVNIGPITTTLQPNSTIITFTVTSQSGSVKNYTINVLDSDTSISTITINDTIYTNLNMINTISDGITTSTSTIQFTGIINDVSVIASSSATVEPPIFELQPNGSTIITFSVTAQDEITIQYYIIAVDQMLVCFKEGSKILTDQGYRLIEELRPGDFLKTQLNDYKPIVMMGKKEIFQGLKYYSLGSEGSVWQKEKIEGISRLSNDVQLMVQAHD